jgi:predicted ATP-dependent endonuclease of OLD family
MQNTHLPFFGVKNFKSFKGEHFFNLKNITFLIGKNSSGKSSLIQGIQLSSKSPNEVQKSNDFGLKESWLNRYSDEKLVMFSTKVKINSDYLSNRFYTFHDYYINDKNPVFFEDYFFNEILLRKGIVEPKYTTNYEYKSNYGESNVLPLVYFDAKQNKFISNDDLEKLFDEILSLSKERSQRVSELFNYKIKSAEERQRWINEKNRLIELNKFPDVISNVENIIDYMMNEGCKFYVEFIDFIVNNYDLETEIILPDEYQKIIHKILENISKDCIELELITKKIDLIELPELKKLFQKIIQYDYVYPKLDFFKFGGREHKNNNQSNEDKQKDIQNYFSDIPLISYFVSIEKKNCDVKLIGKKEFKIDFSIIEKLEQDEGIYKEKIDFLNKYLREFNIGDKIDLEKIEFNGRIEFKPFIIKNNEKLDYHQNNGFGIQMLVPLILNLVTTKESVLLLEEPESNLHPALQAKLADFLVECSTKFNIQFVVETHSEYIIRRMQYLVANTHFGKNKTLPKISTENTNIYYFNDPKELEKETDYTFEINFKKDGGLTKSFGPGFFDVTDDIAYELFMLKNRNLN